MSGLREAVIGKFQSIYGDAPKWVARGPGRVNLIGEHTDYNDGFVLPMALDRAVWIALAPTDDRRVTLHLMDFGKQGEFSLDDIAKGDHTPIEYVKGVATMMIAEGHSLRGWRGVMKGDVPIGAGLSSSAALEMAVARAFCAISDIPWDAKGMALLGQRVENHWLGLKTGIMDQMISAAGENGHALLIDCRALEWKLAPVPSGSVAVIMDTGTRRGLVNSAYNERREQCEAAAKHFHVKALRDVSVEQFTAHESELSDLTRRRARHVVTENARALAAFEAMVDGDARVLGALMDASHDSLQFDFEVSTDALNTMVAIARRHPACYGARMTGAGFGGCAVALVKSEFSEDFAAWVWPQYQTATGNTPALYVCAAAQGASVSPIDSM